MKKAVLNSRLLRDLSKWESFVSKFTRLEKICVITVALWLPFDPVKADSDLQFSGFGTLGISYENEDDLGFVRDLGLSKDPDRDVSFLTDSIFGLQASFNFNDHWRATAQMVLRDSSKQDLNSATELAFIAYRPRPDMDLRLGRVPIDMFMMSDFRRVDYVNLWVRPPTELYAWILPTYLDGADFATTYLSGDYFWRAKIQYGTTEPDFESVDGEEQFSATFDEFIVGTLAVDFIPWKGRVSFAQFDVDDTQLEFIPALNALAQFPGLLGLEASQLGALLESGKNKRTRYYQAGISYDDGTWLLDAEYAGLHSESSFIADGSAGYISVGRHLHAFTPFLVYSKFFPEDEPFVSTADWSVVPGGELLRDVAVGVANGVFIEQHTVSLGLRWDFTTKAALKIQWDRTSITEDGYAIWAYTNGRNFKDTQVELFSLSFNFIF